MQARKALDARTPDEASQSMPQNQKQKKVQAVCTVTKADQRGAQQQ
jgi:hypothetical protein